MSAIPEDMIAEAITESFGERCLDFDPGCWTCKAWAQYGALLAERTSTRNATLEEAAKICEQQRESFLSPEYATGQPSTSFFERFACGECAIAIRREKTE